MDELCEMHRVALDALVAAGEITAPVADHVQTAFEAAAYHVWRSNAPITCYEPVLIDYRPVSSSELILQADLLAELADENDWDPETVERAQDAIERDITFLNLDPQALEALYEALSASAEDAYAIPAFEALDLEVTPEAAAAAVFLIDVLLEP
jgi:hypothetical protein